MSVEWKSDADSFFAHALETFIWSGWRTLCGVVLTYPSVEDAAGKATCPLCKEDYRATQRQETGAEPGIEGEDEEAEAAHTEAAAAAREGAGG